jgi:putative hydrolase
MDIAVDTHTHTVASGHAYSTLTENASAAAKAGLSLLCTTDHAPKMPGAPHYWFFNNQKILPRFLEGVGIIRGVEANICNEAGEIDLPESSDPLLDWVLGSFHEPIFHPSDSNSHTTALIAAIESGRVDALGHLGNPNYPFDVVAVLQCAKQHNVAIEVNNTSLIGNSRKGSEKNCDTIVSKGAEIGVLFTTGSDAHFYDQIGQLQLAVKLLQLHNVPLDKVITSSASRFLRFLELRGKSRIAEFDSLY